MSTSKLSVFYGIDSIVESVTAVTAGSASESDRYRESAVKVLGDDYLWDHRLINQQLNKTLDEPIQSAVFPKHVKGLVAHDNGATTVSMGVASVTRAINSAKRECTLAQCCIKKDIL